MAESVLSLTSSFLGNTRSVWVQPLGDRPTRLLMLLDAEFYRGGIDAESTVRRLVETGVIAPLWLVGVSHHSLEARWIEAPCHEPFARFVQEELMPALTAGFPDLARVTHRVLAGVSYTGLAAAFLAWRCPGLFQRVICQSGSFWWNEGWLPRKWIECGVSVPTDFHLEVGSRETKPYVRHREDAVQTMSQIEGVERFRAALEQTGHHTVSRVFAGGHDFASWKLTLPDAVTWALGRSSNPSGPARPNGS